MKKTLIVMLAVLILVGSFGMLQGSVVQGLLSWFFGPGAGEWLTKKATFGQCCIEELWGMIPVFGWLVWIGSIMDGFKNVDDPQINYLFGTKSLAK